MRESAILPVFKYHPDPIATGSIEVRNITCVCCGEQSPYVYVASAYSIMDLAEVLCPWCISDGLAHHKFAVEFTDLAAIGDEVDGSPALRSIQEEIAYRTPGFSSWQQERWLMHCGDGCAFLGPAGKQQVEAIASPELIDSLCAETELDDDEFDAYLDTLDRDCGPTAYIFRCLHCGQYLGYSDCL